MGKKNLHCVNFYMLWEDRMFWIGKVRLFFPKEVCGWWGLGID